MRLLSVRAGHECGLAAQSHPQADRSGHRPRHERQHLPLRHLCPHPRRNPCGSQVVGGLIMTVHVKSASAAAISRRSLLKAGAGLVLATYVARNGVAYAQDAAAAKSVNVAPNTFL